MRRFALGGALLVFTTAIAIADLLTFPLRKDEVHFWETTQEYFSDSLIPTADDLHEYPEVITPLAFIVWGQIDRLTDHGIVVARALNVVVALLLLLMLIYGNREDPSPGPPAAIGLLLFPYFAVLSVHVFTDLLGAFLVGVAVHFQLGRRYIPALLFWVLAISTRQYLVEISAAFAAWEGLRSLLGTPRWKETAVAVLGSSTLIAWMVFFGGVASAGGMAVWIDPYPAPMLSPFEFILSYGLYFLAGLAAYFVIPEMLLFRTWPSLALLRERWVWVAVLLLGFAFIVDVPLLSEHFPGGFLGRGLRVIFPSTVAGDSLRALVLFLLALLTVLRFGRSRDLAFWVIAAGWVLSMKAQIPWDKYLLPVLLVLWQLRSRADAEGGIRSAWESTSFRWLDSPAATPDPARQG